ncbi:MAG: hypothetical protein HC926_01285 [Synechococcaceae cyanobacterium SM2_3_60]|nr:hypothetical protein [Synechococcaceae cyanobacterium SM2_3_60]
MAERSVPGIEALLRGLTEDDILILQEALNYFDGSYRDLMEHLKSLGATQTVYRRVNATIKGIMGKSRTEVDLWNPDEMETWGDGYQYSRELMQDINQACEGVRDGFLQALQERS